MRWQKIVLMAGMLLALLPAVAGAGDFDWMKDFNIRAEADAAGFRARLTARFHIGDAQVTAVLSNVAGPADAYMIFRLGEMSGLPADSVVEKYRSGHGKGWGVLAKSLGIKPGSKEFHALKRGDDLYGDEGGGKAKRKGRHKGR